MTETTQTATPLEILDGHVAPELRPRAWEPLDMHEAEEAAKERSTCSTCLARTYRQEECVCEDEGDAEDYDEALMEEQQKRTDENKPVVAGFYNPHGSHVETVEGKGSTVAARAARFIENMASESYPCSIIIEPSGAGE